MERDYSVILLTTSGDFLLEEKEQISKQEHGVVAEKPYVINDDEQAQRIQADKIFIPYPSLDSIQYGEFSHETLE